jgi:hypothetical protein
MTELKLPPDCIARSGKYYFYFPANAMGSSGRGFGIGVAVAGNPTGPYTQQSEPIKNVHGIDPCPFIDKDGQVYLYYLMGPFNVTGVIMDESPTGCWTIHQSIVEFNNQWYLFYNNNDLSPKFDKNRSVRIDSLFFYPDGTIRIVTPTFCGVGVTSALQKIETASFLLK